MASRRPWYAASVMAVHKVEDNEYGEQQADYVLCMEHFLAAVSSRA
jgi:hypothetical protein